jgi:hypothetical protein
VVVEIERKLRMNQVQPELHLFIVWEHAQKWKKEILKDIKKDFKILDIYNIQWSPDNYTENLNRFYGESLPNGSEKELECGKGRFSLIIVLDESPRYSERPTYKGTRLVNVNMFDAKMRYRELVGGGSKVHATDNVAETKQDLFLLVGENYDEYMEKNSKKNKKILKEKELNRNLSGCIQWDSFQQLFSFLNQTTQYVVLRNFEGMPHRYYEEGHGDIDILVDANPSRVAQLMNAKRVFSKKYRVHHKVNINGETIRFDIRYVGDNYYDPNWSRKILEKRIPFNTVYVPDEENFNYALLYHAIIHKADVPMDYKEKLENLGFDSAHFFEALQKFMDKKGYRFTPPNDLSVHFNNTLAKQSISLRRRIVSFKHKMIAFGSACLSPNLKAKIRRLCGIERFLTN